MNPDSTTKQADTQQAEAVFTKGPWLVSGSSVTRLEIFSDEPGRSAHVCTLTPRYPQDEANAQLISASPDLYEACRRLAEFCRRTPQGKTLTVADIQGIWNDAESALSRATGRSE